MNPNFPLDSQERGMALVVALVFLLLLTLLGLNSMQNATLQEKMSSSVQFRNQSLQVAEAALRVGEAAVSKSGFKMAKCSTFAACAPPPDSSLIDGARNGVNVTWVKADEGGLYAIQNLGDTDDAVRMDDTPAFLYRITGVGMVGNARTVLESIYAIY